MSYKYNPRDHRKTYRWFRGNIRHLKSYKVQMTPEKFRDIEKLYHYTSFKNGMFILQSQTMIMSKPIKMNDINENNRFISCDNEKNDIGMVMNEMERYFQSSFTRDDGKIPGFAIAAMWGHYAENGKGMCLVFDKRKLLSRIKDEEFFKDKVTYEKDFDSSICVEGNPKEYIQNNTKEVFFTKSDDWSYEREFRVVRRSLSSSVEIDLTGCIIAVIVHDFVDTPSDGCVYNAPSYINLVNRVRPLKIPVLVFSKDSISGPYSIIEGENGGRDWLIDDYEGLILDI